MPTIAAATTFGEVLASRAEMTPDQMAFTYLRDREGGEESVSYLELHGHAQGIAARVLEVVEPGERVLLLFAPGGDYVSAVFGCFQAGVVGVCAVPPHPKRLHRTLPRLLAIAEDADVHAVLTTTALRDAAQPLLAGDQPLGRATWIAVDDGTADAEPGVVRCDSSDLAFMQYTSGSTSDPRGVLLTHGNLMANSEFICDAYGHSSESRGFIWLPPYHDMGLIGGILGSVYAGFPTALMPPTAVIKRPWRWLEGISSFRATTSGGPNFAYDLAVRRVPDEVRERIDLSCWEVAFNGAEPIRADTIDAFCEAFGPCGFRRSAFYPCYGLAEATLMVTGIDKDAEPTLLELDAAALEEDEVRSPEPGGRTVRLVGCGQPHSDHEVVIVDPETRRALEEGEIGEIWVSGPSVAAGYWRREEATAELFGARLAGEEDGASYLRTGDLGFFQGGELFVTGRIKDLIILSGRNYHPHDVEKSAEAAHQELRPHCSAAFSTGDGGAGIVLEIQPISEDELPAVLQSVRARVAGDLEIQLELVALTVPGALPKTTSGKIQRQLSRRLLEEREIEVRAEWRAGS